jgi:glycosyltransferase involved in cell wall biosynthesis
MSKINKDEIRVLHLLSSAEIAGGERYLYDLINHGNGLISHYISLPYNGPFAKILKDSGLSFDIVPLMHKYFIRSLVEIIKLVKAKNIDIIHTHGYRANLYGRIACIFTRTKNIATVHVSLFDYKDTPFLLRYVYILIEHLLSFKTSKYICISNAMAEDAKKIGIPETKIVVIMNGVDTSRFYHRPLASRKKVELHISPDTQVIGTIGRMVNEKGQIYLVEALKIIKDKIRNVQCVFVGDGPTLPLLKRRAAELKLKNSCIFIGVQPKVELIYPVFDIFVLPSLREPFGLVLLEAMANKIPVIATNRGGPCEYINSGVNGVLINPCDPESIALETLKLLRNKEEANKLAKNGEKLVKNNFNVKNVVKKVDKIYLSLVKV